MASGRRERRAGARQAGAAASYRVSHAAPGYGEYYERTYQRGYELAQWTRLEKPLLRGILQEQYAAGARRLLDFACGTGRILHLAEEFFPITWGIDVSETMLGIGRERCRHSTLLHRDLTREPLDEHFDVVTAFRFFLGAEPELRDAALQAITAVLAPGGVLIANVHVNRTSLLGLAYRISNRLVPWRTAETLGWPEFRRLLERHGFRVRAVRWYSYLPRTGPWLPWLPRYLMEPVEKVCERFPFVFEGAAQCFLVVCEAPRD